VLIGDLLYYKNPRIKILGKLLDNTPIIGQWMLDEAAKLDDTKESHAQIHEVLSGLREMSCLVLALVQWIEIQLAPEVSAARQTLARSILTWAGQQCSSTQPDGVPSSSADQQQQEITNRLMFSLVVARGALNEMMENARRQSLDRPVYTWVINFSRRELPTLDYHSSIPDLQMLKEAFLYACKVGWATPDVLAHVARCNRAVQFGWCRVGAL